MTGSRLNLFDGIERTDQTRREPGEPLVVYLNRSAMPEVAIVRNRLEGWYANYPADAKKIGFLGETDGDFFAKSFELLVHESLIRLGCTILAVEPDVSGSNAKPDFWVEADRVRFYVECTTVNPEHPTLAPATPINWEHRGPVGGEVRDSIRIRRKLRDKARKHAALNAPLILALTGGFFDDDDLDDQVALFRYSKRNLWFRDGRPVNKHVNAVWMFHHAMPYSIEIMTACLYISPWTEIETIPPVFRKFSHVKVHKNTEYEQMPGKDISELLRG